MADLGIARVTKDADSGNTLTRADLADVVHRKLGLSRAESAGVVERVDRNPRLKARFGPWYFAQSAVRTFLERYVVRPPQLDVEINGKPTRGLTCSRVGAAPLRTPSALSSAALRGGAPKKPSASTRAP